MGKTIRVSGADELTAALQAATGGETILLDGGDYGRLQAGKWSQIEGRFRSEVTVASADPEAPAVFDELVLREVENLTIRNVTFQYDAEPGVHPHTFEFIVQESESVAIEGSTFIGDIDENGTGTGIALLVRDSTDVLVDANEFREWYRGVMVLDSDTVAITGNDIHSLRSDGIDVAGTQGVVISENHLHSFQGLDGSVDHRDMIQFWSAGTNRPSTDIYIRDNLLDAGDGDWTQSIFMRNEAVDSLGAGDEMLYRNVNITGNVILNGHHHGITLGEADGVMVARNTILQRDAGLMDMSDVALSTPKINMNPTSRDVRVVDNVAGGLTGMPDSSAVSGNVVLQTTNPEAADYLGRSVALSSVQEGMPILLENGLVAQQKAGSNQVEAAMADAPLRAVFDAYRVEDAPTTRVFDASVLMQQQGLTPADLGAMRFEWRFSDGSVADGVAVRHDFGAAGLHEAELTVIAPDGTASSTRASLGIDTDLAFALTRGGFDVHRDGEVETVSGASGTIDVTTPFSVSGTALHRIYNAESLTMDLTLSADRLDATGKILTLHSALMLSTSPRGELAVSAMTEEDGFVTLPTGVYLSDGRPHDVSIRYDGTARTLEAVVDGVSRGELQLTGELADSSRALTFGDPWGGPSYDGMISAFEIRVDDPIGTPFEGAFGGAEEPGEVGLSRPGEGPAVDEGALRTPSDPLTASPPPAPTPLEDAGLPGPSGPDPAIALTAAGLSAEDAAGASRALTGMGPGAIDLRAGFSVADEALAQVYEAESLRMDLTLAADAPEAAGKILTLHSALLLSTSSRGDLAVSAMTEADGFVTLSTGVHVSDGASHDVSIRYDGEARTVEAVVDGVSRGVLQLEDDLGLGTSRALTFGDPWGGPRFEGTVSAFEVVLDEPSAGPPAGPPAMALPENVLGDDLGEGAPIFDLARDAGEGGVSVHGGAAMAADGTIDLSGDAAHARLHAAEAPETDGAFTASVEFAGRADADGLARLLWSHESFGIEVGDGVVRVHARVEDGPGLHVFEARADALGAEEANRVTVAIDGEMDRIQIRVDDAVVLDETGTADIALADAPGGWGWWLGSPTGPNRFEGEVTAATIHDEALFEREDDTDDAALLG